MGLQEYRRKRNFGRTPEPQGGKASQTGRVFVVQKHAATRLHYDFRLELDGVLKSWAVTKGPSLNPADRRLAVETEDHPMDYGVFEGIIPKGQYGGGTVMLWDCGSWEPVGDPHEGLAKGALKFRLHGEKMHGLWALIRMNEERGRRNWLLIKDKDDEASRDRDLLDADRSVSTGRSLGEIRDQPGRVWSGRREALQSVSGSREAPAPDLIAPMLATLVKEAPDGDEWLHEIKFDGYRTLIRLVNGKVSIYTRGGNDWTNRFQPIARAAAKLPVGEAWIDGEAVVLNASGASNFQALQQALADGRSDEISYFAFDLLYLDGWDLRDSALADRKALLAGLLKEAEPPLRYSDHVQGNGPDFRRQACVFALEGCISKRANAPYRSGRQGSWLKAKCVNRQEFVVGGFTLPTGRKSGIGAMLLGVYENGRLVPAGRVGTGFTEAEQVDLYAHFGKLRRKTQPFSGKLGDRAGVIWVEPETVIEAEFAQWTRDGQVRHASYQGLRKDKKPEEVRRELPTQAERPADKPSPVKRKPARRTAMPALARLAPGELDARITALELSNPGKVLFAAQGVTKKDLAAYYLEVADWILPHVAERPLVLVRCPQGGGKKCFYQRHRHDGLPSAVKGIECGDEAPCVYIDSVDGLVGLVQVGVLEIHTWGAPIASLDHPDRLVFDLDPDEAMAWEQLAEGARRVRAELDGLGLTSFLKTTGGKGLHLTVPIRPDQDWETIKAFCKAIAQRLEDSDPARYVVNMSKAKRKGRIFIDYLRNQRSASFVAPFSPRAREGAPVAAPLFWHELDAGIRPAHFSVTNLTRRLAALTEDPWAAMKDCRQDIGPAVAEVLGKRR